MRSKRGVSFAARFRRDLKRAGVLRRELFVPSERTLPVDFHSLRRAFVTKLAVAGINVQRAMALAGHTDTRTHLLYVGAAPELREIPEEVVPVLSFGSSTKTPLLESENPRATQDSNLRPSAPESDCMGQYAPQNGTEKGWDSKMLWGVVPKLRLIVDRISSRSAMGFGEAPAGVERSSVEPLSVSGAEPSVEVVSTEVTSAGGLVAAARRALGVEADAETALRLIIARRRGEAREVGEALAERVVVEALRAPVVRLALDVLLGGSDVDHRLVELCEVLMEGANADKERAA